MVRKNTCSKRGGTTTLSMVLILVPRPARVPSARDDLGASENRGYLILGVLIVRVLLFGVLY